MKIIFLSILLACSFSVGAAEVTFTDAELAALKGEPGADGADGANGINGADGADGTRIIESSGICSMEGGLWWPCFVKAPDPDAPPEPPADDEGSEVNDDGTITLVWLPPFQYADGSPLDPADIQSYRIFSQRPGEDWTYAGNVTRATVRLTASRCYRMQTIVAGRPRSAMSEEICW